MSPIKILQDERAYASEMKIYFHDLKKQSQTSTKQAQEEAIDALKRTGVIEKDGSAKSKIVSWEWNTY